MIPSKNTTPPMKLINQSTKNQNLLSAEEQKELKNHLSSQETNNFAFLHAATMNAEATLNELKEALRECEDEGKAAVVAKIKKELEDPKLFPWIDNLAYNTPVNNELPPLDEKRKKVLIEGYNKVISIANKVIIVSKASESTGRTPLHYVALHNDLAKAEILIKSNADLNITDSRGNTPLHTAATSFEYTLQRANGDISGAINLHAPIMGLLIKSGTDVSLKNGDGKTAFQMVEEASAKVSKGLTKVSPSSEALIQAYEDHKKEQSLAPDPKVQTLDTVKSTKTGWVEKVKNEKPEGRVYTKAEEEKTKAELAKQMKKMDAIHKEWDVNMEAIKKYADEQSKLKKKPSKNKSSGCIMM